MDKAYRIIDLKASDTGNGSLSMFQAGKNGVIPFTIKKVLVVSGMKPTDVRGKHAHRLTQEVIVPIQGGCTVSIDDGKTVETVRLSGKGKALYLAAQTWRVLSEFEPGTILLMIADQEYDEKEYVREYAEFRKMIIGA